MPHLAMTFGIIGIGAAVIWPIPVFIFDFLDISFDNFTGLIVGFLLYILLVGQYLWRHRQIIPHIGMIFGLIGIGFAIWPISVFIFNFLGSDSDSHLIVGSLLSTLLVGQYLWRHWQTMSHLAMTFGLVGIVPAIWVISVLLDFTFQDLENNREDKNAWETARQQNTEEAYRTYLDGNTVRNYAEEAKQLLKAAMQIQILEDKNAWLQAHQQNTYEAYQWLEQALADKKAWIQALKQNTKEAYQAYLDGNTIKRYDFLAKYLQKVSLKKREDKNAWENALKQNTKYAYQAYLDRNTVKKYAKEAKQLLKAAIQMEKLEDENAWQQAHQQNTKEAYQAYLYGNTVKNYAKEAKVKLDKYFKVFRDSLADGSSGPEMIWIPAGSFKMGDIQGGGDDDEKPVHEVSVGKFAMGKYEVTNAEFVKFLNAVKRRGDNNEPWFKTKAEDSDSHITGSVGNFKVESGYDDHPIIEVSWYGATAYTKWLSDQTDKTYRLPTEAEWEYAARAGTETKFWWGNKASHEYANYGKDDIWASGLAKGKDRWKYTSPVGSFVPNQFGLYDTSGNVWEWTCSLYVKPYNNMEKQCVTNGRILSLRGGSWYCTPTGVRSAYRYGYSPADRSAYDGFRVSRQ
jgi:formylglycine-generating enzyme required for sulfatase activity